MKNHRAEGYCRTLECEGVEEDSGDRLNFNSATGSCLYSLRVSTYFKNKKKTQKEQHNDRKQVHASWCVCVWGGRVSHKFCQAVSHSVSLSWVTGDSESTKRHK